jgi:hypothetical protein
MLVVALGLGALIWSCESEQTGYDVAIPLIGPMEFDETSCEVSGDICSTDDDCFDEDGLPVGPCTKTMEELAAITVPVSLSPSNPSYTLGAVDTAGWTNLFLAQQFSDGEVPEGARINMTMDGFSLQGGPVTIAVRIFSRVGLIAGQNADYEPVTPSSCTFVLESDAMGQDYADGINTCLSDWIAENGSPVDFDMEVTSSEGAAAKSGFGPKQLEYTVLGTWTMASGKQCEVDWTDDVLEAVREGEGFFALLECAGNLSVEGSGTNDQELDLFSGSALIWDPCGQETGGTVGPATPLPPGDYTVAVAVEGSGEEPDVPVEFHPSGVIFVESLFVAAAGDCLSGEKPEPGSEGSGFAGWIHCGDPPPPTRTGSITVNASGFCPVAEGSGAAGPTGQ